MVCGVVVSPVTHLAPSSIGSTNAHARTQGKPFGLYQRYQAKALCCSSFQTIINFLQTVIPYAESKGLTLSPQCPFRPELSVFKFDVSGSSRNKHAFLPNLCRRRKNSAFGLQIGSAGIVGSAFELNTTWTLTSIGNTEKQKSQRYGACAGPFNKINPSLGCGVFE